ncbi:unnamed protein product [Laminaria digitata]
MSILRFTYHFFRNYRGRMIDQKWTSNLNWKPRAYFLDLLRGNFATEAQGWFFVVPYVYYVGRRGNSVPNREIPGMVLVLPDPVVSFVLFDAPTLAGASFALYL